MPHAASRIKTRNLWLPALGGALLLHVFLIAVARVRPATPGPQTGTELAPCTMLQPGPAPFAWERHLLDQVTLRDPSIFTLPDPARGFSGFLTVPEDPPVVPPPGFQAVPVSPPEPAFSPVHLTAARLPLEAALEQHWTPEFPGRPPAEAPAALPQAVLWRLADGTRLANVPDVPLAELRSALAAGRPEKPSQFEVIVGASGHDLRLRLSGSCGNRTLDRLAYERIARLGLAWEQGLRSRPPPADLEWLTRQPGLPAMVEVEWRTAPEPPAEAKAATVTP